VSPHSTGNCAKVGSPMPMPTGLSTPAIAITRAMRSAAPGRWLGRISVDALSLMSARRVLA
jgi:hypothetical protein